jgi:protein tyrosine phosphatase
MIRWIENVSWDAVKNGFHSDMGQNAMLIQIADPATFFPVPKHTFKEVHQFEFLDAEDGDRFPDECMIQDEQAVELVRLLQNALDKSMNVLVHCHAGICRSGAVVEVGSMMGFTPTERFRMPNLRVKHKMMKVLGLTYDSEEKHEAINGVMTSSGIVLPKGEWE